MSQTLQRTSPIQLGPMPAGRAMETVDERVVRKLEMEGLFK